MKRFLFVPIILRGHSYGGNMIYIARDLNLVVAITSNFKLRCKDRIKLIEEYIIPYL